MSEPLSSFRSSYHPAPNIRSTRYGKGQAKKLRGDAPAPQAQIVMTVDTSCDKIQRTHDPDKAWAPMSDDSQVQHVIRGELAAFVPDAYDNRGLRPGLNGGTLVQVTTNVNGFPKAQPFSFAGGMTNAGMGKGEDLTVDNAAALVLSGTFGTINSGADLIPALNHVFVTPDPYKSKDAENNVIPGIQGNDMAPSKFLLATHSLTSVNTLTLVKRVEGCVMEIFMHQAPSTSNALWAAIENKNEMILEIHRTHPMWYYGFMHATRLLGYYFEDNPPLSPAEKFKFWAKAHNEYNKFVEDSKSKYQQALNIYSTKLTKKRRREDEVPMPGSDEDKRAKRDSILMADHACSDLQAKQHDCLSSTYAGLALNTSATGKSLDLIIGHAHF